MDCQKSTYFYPRSPCGERPLLSSYIIVYAKISIHALLAESDILSLKKIYKEQNFYPRSPCGERRRENPLSRVNRHFYPRSPCGERPIAFKVIICLKDFYPRSPCGERLAVSAALQLIPLISIHALLAESDVLALCSCGGASDFYPRSPCGERLISIVLSIQPTKFLSTLSLRRATRGAVPVILII